MSEWPDTRPVSYDPDVAYDETNDVWSSDPTVLVETAARYKSFVVACSYGEIFYTEV